MEDFNTDQQYYSKSAQKTQNLEGKLKEDGETEKFQMHSSVLYTKENQEFIVGESNSIYFNTETEKPQNFNEEYFEEVDEDWDNNELSENPNLQGDYFNKINHLGFKRRSRSALRLREGWEKSEKSEGFEDYEVDNSPKNWAIDKMPSNNRGSVGIMMRLSECTNSIDKNIISRKR